jgi:hypothetical protein
VTICLNGNASQLIIVTATSVLGGKPPPETVRVPLRSPGAGGCQEAFTEGGQNLGSIWHHRHPIGLSVKAQKKWLEWFFNSATQQR